MEGYELVLLLCSVVLTSPSGRNRSPEEENWEKGGWKMEREWRKDESVGGQKRTMGKGGKNLRGESGRERKGREGKEGRKRGKDIIHM